MAQLFHVGDRVQTTRARAGLVCGSPGTIRQVFPGTLVTPYLTVGGTDSRYFIKLTPNIYKFTPIVADPSDLTRMHGLNERMAVTNYVQVVQFFVQLIRNSDVSA